MNQIHSYINKYNGYLIFSCFVFLLNFLLFCFRFLFLIFHCYYFVYCFHCFLWSSWHRSCKVAVKSVFVLFCFLLLFYCTAHAIKKHDVLALIFARFFSQRNTS